MANWDREINFDKLGMWPPTMWQADPPHLDDTKRARWVAEAAGLPEGGQFVDSVIAITHPRPAHVTLSPADDEPPAHYGARGWQRDMIAWDWCLDHYHRRWWCSLAVRLVVDDHHASWVEPRGTGVLVATDAHSQNPIRFVGQCVTWVLVPTISGAFARSLIQQAVVHDFDPGHGVFAAPRFRECPVLTTHDR
jgi:hypothetical protein